MVRRYLRDVGVVVVVVVFLFLLDENNRYLASRHDLFPLLVDGSEDCLANDLNPSWNSHHQMVVPALLLLLVRNTEIMETWKTTPKSTKMERHKRAKSKSTFYFVGEFDFAFLMIAEYKYSGAVIPQVTKMEGRMILTIEG